MQTSLKVRVGEELHAQGLAGARTASEDMQAGSAGNERLQYSGLVGSENYAGRADSERISGRAVYPRESQGRHGCEVWRRACSVMWESWSEL